MCFILAAILRGCPFKTHLLGKETRYIGVHRGLEIVSSTVVCLPWHIFKRNSDPNPYSYQYQWAPWFRHVPPWFCSPELPPLCVLWKTVPCCSAQRLERPQPKLPSDFSSHLEHRLRQEVAIEDHLRTWLFVSFCPGHRIWSKLLKLHTLRQGRGHILLPPAWQSRSKRLISERNWAHVHIWTRGVPGCWDWPQAPTLLVWGEPSFLILLFHSAVLTSRKLSPFLLLFIKNAYGMRKVVLLNLI